MKRLIFNGSYLHLPQTGIATYCRNILSHWQRNCPNLVAYLPTDWAATPGYRPIPTTNHLTRLLWNQWHWGGKVRAGDVLFHPVPEGGWGRGAIVTVAHDVIPLRYPEFYPRKVAYFRHWVPLSLGSARRIICVSEQTRRDLVQFYRLDPERITVIPAACDHYHFTPGVGVTAKTPYLLYVGSHEPHKNLALLLASYRTLRRAWAGELWIGGRFDPRYTPALQASAGAGVRWLDYVSYADLPDLYRGAVGFIFPSLYEGFGLPVLEAMACGTPVVCAASSSLPEVGGEAALYFEPESEAALTAQLQRLVGDETLQSQLRIQGLARAALFDWAITAQRTLAVCEEVSQNT